METEKAQPDTPLGVKKWQGMLDSELWPVPNWCGERSKRLGFRFRLGPGKDRLGNYDALSIHRLRIRYMELESDFRMILGGYDNLEHLDLVVAEGMVHLLQMARELLEQKGPDLLTVSSTLDSVARYMVWLYPHHVAIPRAAGVLSHLESLPASGKEPLIDLLTRASETAREDSEDILALERLRSVLDETMGAIHRFATQEQLDNDVRLERLRELRLWGMAILVAFLVASPLVTNLEVLTDWPSQLIFRGPRAFIAWIMSLGIVIVGAVGGFFSGLPRVRRSQVTLAEHQENMLKLQIKPLIGSLVSLILFILLSWQILPGIRIDNAGFYFLIAFLSGFSERYLLRLLEIETGSKALAREIGPSKLESDMSEQHLLGLLEHKEED
jgi:hypothetical protein